MNKLILTLILTTTLFSQTFRLNLGWNLVGARADIPTHKILSNSNVKNILIYTSGGYKSTKKNEFQTIPANSGFFIYAIRSTVISIQSNNSSIEVAKVNDKGEELLNNATSWSILHLKGVKLYIEMKNDFSVGQKYGIKEEAEKYCENLKIGDISGWRLPTVAELTGISSIYAKYTNFFTTINNNIYWTKSLTRKFYVNIITGRTSRGVLNNIGSVICVKESP